MGCEVGTNVRHGGEPFAAPFRGDWDVPQQFGGDALMGGAGAAQSTQVLSELLVVQAVHGSVLVEVLDEVTACLLEQPGDVFVGIVLPVGERCR
jgi:hypothetical protein